MKRILLDENKNIINIIECAEDDPFPGSYEYFKWNRIGDPYITLTDKLQSDLDIANSAITDLQLALAELYEATAGSEEVKTNG